MKNHFISLAPDKQDPAAMAKGFKKWHSKLDAANKTQINGTLEKILHLSAEKDADQGKTALPPVFEAFYNCLNPAEKKAFQAVIRELLAQPEEMLGKRSVQAKSLEDVLKIAIADFTDMKKPVQQRYVLLEHIPEMIKLLASKEEKDQAAKILVPGLKIVLEKEKCNLLYGADIINYVWSAEKPYTQVFKGPFQSDRGLDMRFSAVKALQALGKDSPDVVPTLILALKQIPAYKASFGNGKYPDSERLETDYPIFIIQTLASFGPDAEAAVPVLAQIMLGKLGTMSVHSKVRQEACLSLGEIGSKNPVVRLALLQAVVSGDAALASAAKKVLEKVD